ncbi:MAG: prepilin peptidase [Alphaproteobacteria bacterium]|nr:prepilin peptidase [Alphaproteobacteria bacterium]
MFFIIISLLIIIHILIGVYDFSFYRIPNLFLGVLVVLYAFFAPIYLDSHAILSALLVFAVTMAVGYCLYALKVIGAGDAKYIAVTSLWFGVHGIVPLLFLISLAGGILAVLYLVFKDHIGHLSDRIWLKIQKTEENYPKLQNVWIGSGTGPEKGKRENIGSRMVPYGIAIAAGSIIMLIISPITHL